MPLGFSEPLFGLEFGLTRFHLGSIGFSWVFRYFHYRLLFGDVTRSYWVFFDLPGFHLVSLGFNGPLSGLELGLTRFHSGLTGFSLT